MKGLLLYLARKARRGERALDGAIKVLDGLAEQLEGAESVLRKEIEFENEQIAAERERLALREATSAAALAKLDAARQRSRRIYDRVAGFTA